MSWAEVAGLCAFGVIALFLILIIYTVSVATEGDVKAVCEQKCPANHSIIGSSTLNKYFSCDCKYAKLIRKSNSKCFVSENDAINEGYKKASCSFIESPMLMFRS